MSKKKRSNRGLLIKGSLEKIPAETIEDETFRKKLRELMLGWAGIYVLYKDDKLYYVGLATSSFWRLWGHFKRDRHAGKWNKFSVFRFKKVAYLKDLETLILHISKPKGNRTIGTIPKDFELTKTLRKKATEYRKSAEKIENAIKR
ncbi:GIY-YIG nuclease family protein [Candidatus Micrarchaeota archaeon]|nr:GIY-YIG nuclease family protein [Candidatus Micrarchaeota archaeon]